MKKHGNGKRIGRSSALGLLIGLSLFGCAGNGETETREQSLTADTNTVIVTKEDGIIGYVNEDFDVSLYRFEDLEALVVSEVEDYNSSMGGGGIEIRQCELADGRVLLSLRYEQPEDYERFNSVTLGCGKTIAQAREEYGLPDNLVLVDAHDPDNRITLGELDDGEQYSVLVTDDDSNIRIPESEICYLCEGDKLVSGCEAETTAEVKLHVIIY